MTKPKPPHLKLKPGPKPGTVRKKRAAAAAAEQPVATVATAPAPPPLEPQPAQPRSHDALQRGRSIETMPEAELRQYARQVGISARDAAELAPDRLRANCVLAVQNFIEQF